MAGRSAQEWDARYADRTCGWPTTPSSTAYVQLGVEGFRRAAGWLVPGGRLVVVGHARRNLTDGAHGPQRLELLHDEDELREVARGLEVERLGEVLRPDDGGTALDLVLVARRP